MIRFLLQHSVPLEERIEVSDRAGPDSVRDFPMNIPGAFPVERIHRLRASETDAVMAKLNR